MTESKRGRPQRTGSGSRPSRSRRSFAGFAAAVQNGIEIARFGGLGEREPSPFEVVQQGQHHRLRRYFPDAKAESSGLPVLLVPPLMLSSEIWDVDSESSAVATLHESGAQPFVVDFGSPEKETGGLDRTMTDHVVAVDEAISEVRRLTGRDVHLMGYSQGGMFAYQAAAYRRSNGVASLVTFGSSVDLHSGLPGNLPAEFLGDSIDRFSDLQERLMPEGIPSWATRLSFQMMDPIKTVQQRIDFVRRLYDRETLQQKEGMRRFLEVDGWTAFPGPALREFMKQLVAGNRLLQGGLVIDGQSVTLADLTCPILVFVGMSDSIAPPEAVRPIYAAAPQSDTYQVKVPAGHFGLVVGSRSSEITWPSVIDWLAWCDQRGPLPERATRLVARPPKKRIRRTPADEFRDGAAYLMDLGRDTLRPSIARGSFGRVGERIGFVGRLADSVATQLPRLSRLAEIRRDTAISPGKAFSEQARRAPDAPFFLFENRAVTYGEANTRVDNVVRGLIECGVRQGQLVGLLMETRPSAVTASLALSRLGAIVVLLRPDIPIDAQIAIAPIDHLLTDPEHARAAHVAFDRDVLVLGGGADPRDLGDGIIDMESVDPDAVELPEWFRADSGTAGEVALWMVSGDTDRIGISRLTNRRWATSAYGTASACALTARDTVYCCSPIHHPTGVLVCIGGAIVSGARLAMATHFGASVDPTLFWDDVRRYGVNVVFYAGSLARVLVNAPIREIERHHPLRLLAGSGMPKGLWKRVAARFRPAQVVEFFASTEGNAVLVNLTGKKVGSLGRPLPGAAEVRIAGWDLQKQRLDEQSSGFAAQCKPGETGLLLARVDPERGEIGSRPLRGVFEPGDAWLSTGDLVRRDADGDYWLVDQLADVIRGSQGAVPTIEIEEQLCSALDWIDLVAVYGVRPSGATAEVTTAAIVLRPEAECDRTKLRQVVESQLMAQQRPIVVRILRELPMTAGHRTRKSVLRADGFGLGEAESETLWLAPGESAYTPLAENDEASLAMIADKA
jgi:putative long chain acyl-CoA synthase